MSASAHSGRGPRIVLALAAVVFLSVTGWMSERVGTWSEEVSAYPSGATVVLESSSDDTPVLGTCSDTTGLRASDVRPKLSLCMGGGTWPVMVDSYFAGWLYWPGALLVPRNVFWQRKLGLLLGLATLLLMYRIVARHADPWMAAAGASATALTASFILPHAILVHYESVVLPLVLGAALAIANAPRDGPLTVRRAALFGLCCGLAVAGNVKAVFLLAALALFAWPARRELPLPNGRGWLVAGGAAAMPIVPMAVFAMADSQGGFSGQISYRLANLVDRISSAEIFTEPLNLLRFWTDPASYGDEAAGLDVAMPILPHVLPALALLWSLWHLGRRLRGRAHNPVAAAAGALIGVYLLVGATLYDQQPAANYAPLQAVFGFVTGGVALAIARAVAPRLAHKHAGVALSVALVLAATAGFGYQTLHRGDPSRLPLATNAVAQRAMVDHLTAQSDGATVVTANYNLAGIPDSISSGALQAVHVGPYASGSCDERLTHEECFVKRWRDIVERLGAMRVVLPSTVALSDERELSSVLPALRELAARGEVTLSLEAEFTGNDTPPLLAVWVVRPTPRSPDEGRE